MEDYESQEVEFWAKLEEEGISTTSGWVTHRLGGFPKVGDVVSVGDFHLRVEEVDGMRVARLKLERVRKPETSLS